MEREGGVLTVYVLGVVSWRIDVVWMADRGLPSRGGGGVGIWVRGLWVVRPTRAVSGTCTVESIVGGGRSDWIGLDVLAALVGAL